MLRERIQSIIESNKADPKEAETALRCAFGYLANEENYNGRI